jgi:hypothetical protein
MVKSFRRTHHDPLWFRGIVIDARCDAASPQSYDHPPDSMHLDAPWHQALYSHWSSAAAGGVRSTSFEHSGQSGRPDETP